MATAAPKIGFVSLGCPKALVDSERIISQLRVEGYALSADYAGADLVVVNTCGFIDAAVEESLEAIGEAVQENGRVIVTGCLGVRDQQVRDAHPQVLAVTGPHAYEEVMQAVHQHEPPPHEPFTDLIPAHGIKLTPRHYAYLKISEGCNHRCSFCIIPSMRGDLVSRPIEDVLREAENLAAAGVKELLVIAQDTSAYGVDIKYRGGFWHGRPLKSRLRDLAGALAELGIWVRLHYMYPYPHVDDVIPLMAAGKLLPYLDMPLQHGSERVLKAMRRPAATAKVLDRIAAWRKECPELTLRSTFIVGFPGESETEFEELLAFLGEAQLDRVGCFRYSPVEGAAANALPGAVDEDVKLEREARFMAVQEEISAARLARYVGRELRVLVDEVDGAVAIARGPGDAPEIDGVVYVPAADDIDSGEFIDVRVTGTEAHDMHAVRLETADNQGQRHD